MQTFRILIISGADSSKKSAGTKYSNALMPQCLNNCDCKVAAMLGLHIKAR